MTTAMIEQLGVAASGRRWETEGYLLLESAEPGVVLYIRRAPALALDGAGRPQAALTRTLRWQDGAYAAVGGSALFTLTLNPALDARALAELRPRWRRALLSQGFPGGEPKFAPLPTRNLRAEPSLDGAAGTAATLGESPSGGAVTVTFALTDAGARQWFEGDRAAVRGGVRLRYEYPQLLPGLLARVSAGGPALYDVLAGALSLATDGSSYGTEADIRAAWAEAIRRGALRVDLDDLPAELQPRYDELRDLCAEQARQQLFARIFAPYLGATVSSVVTPRYALRWSGAEEAEDLDLSISFEAWTWLSATAETALAPLIAAVDPASVATTYAEASIPVTLVVEPEPLLSTVAASLSFSAGHRPEAPVFGSAGGTAQYVVTAARPEEVRLRYKARVSFGPREWPVLETAGEQTVVAGDGRVVLRPGSWVRRHTFYLYVHRGDRILAPSEVAPEDHLVLNVRHQLAGGGSIRSALRITPGAPVEFRYPVPPGVAPGKTTLSAMGVVGGQSVRAGERALDPDDEAVYVLVEGDKVTLVDRRTVLPESGGLAQRLVTAGARPVLRQALAEGARPRPESGHMVGVDVPVFLVPQPTDVSCWAAALTMVISHRDQASYAVETVAEAAGMDVDTGYSWDEIREAVRTWGLRERGPASAMPAEWSRLLRLFGPLWIVEVGAPYHAVVLGGIAGDGTPAGSWVTVYNPWPPQQGAVEYRWFTDFDYEFGLGAGANAMIVHA